MPVCQVPSEAEQYNTSVNELNAYYTGQIGNILGGIDYGAVYLLRRRLREKMAENEAVSEKYKEIEAKVMNACSM